MLKAVYEKRPGKYSLYLLLVKTDGGWRHEVINMGVPESRHVKEGDNEGLVTSRLSINNLLNEDLIFV